MKDSFSKQIEALRREIIAAIRHLLEEHGKPEIDIPDTVDAIYIICFGDDAEPNECIVTNVALGVTDLVIKEVEKNSNDLVFEICGRFELGAKISTGSTRFTKRFNASWQKAITIKKNELWQLI